jgi:hypothetical protein
MSLSPATILYGPDGVTPISVIDDSGVRRLRVESRLEAGTNTLGKVRIVDASGHEIDILSDGKLSVQATISASGVGVLYADLLNGSSRNMNVNGSVTPVVFSWSPGASYDVEGSSLNLVIEEPTISFGDSFFGVTLLTNGLLIEAKAQDRVYNIANFKRTREVVQFTSSGGFELYSATPDLAKVLIGLGGIKFMKAGTYATPDYVRITVRDNISGLNHVSAVFCGKEII